jgi:hypothetical protein
MSTLTLQQATAAHTAAVAKNRTDTVVQPHNGQQRTGRVFEIERGFVHLRDKAGKYRKLGPGHRFEATASQVREMANGRTPLTNKAVEVSASAGSVRPMVGGADIGLRALMPKGLADLAIKAGLTEADFAGLDPEGREGMFSRAQVEAVLAEHEAKQGDEGVTS